MTTAVVTGAGGFIGRHLCARLVADGWTVKVITRGTAPVNTQMLKSPHRDFLNQAIAVDWITFASLDNQHGQVTAVDIRNRER